MVMFLMRTAVAAAMVAAAWSAQARDPHSFKPRNLDGLWQSIPQATVGGGPISTQDFAPRIPGLELLALAPASRCVFLFPPEGPATQRSEYRDRRQWLTTDGVPLPVTIETPLVATTPGPLSCQVVNRASTATPVARGTRVYLYSRALVSTSGAVPDYSVWHLSVYDLDGTKRWTREFRPGGGPDANPDDVNWFVVPSLSAVGDMLGFGDDDDVIRVYRQQGSQTQLVNRYTFLDVLTGAVIKDIQHSVERPVLVP